MKRMDDGKISGNMHAQSSKSVVLVGIFVVENQEKQNISTIISFTKCFGDPCCRVRLSAPKP